VTVSIGVAVYPEHGDTGPKVLAAADDALYAAKAAGRDTYRIARDGALTVDRGLDTTLSQNAMRFHGRIAIDANYNGLALDASEGERIAHAMHGADVVFLGNHGVVVCGARVDYAYDDLYYLERPMHCCTAAADPGGLQPVAWTWRRSTPVRSLPPARHAPVRAIFSEGRYSHLCGRYALPWAGHTMNLPRRHFLHLTAGVWRLPRLSRCAGASLSGAADPARDSISPGGRIRRRRTSVGGQDEAAARCGGR
jgi:hypothetical protein